jgi:23S rRNA (uracil1939-C5)-methyltransferase
MKKNEEIILQLNHLSGDGKAVGKVEGLVVFADNAVPGDLARIRIWKVKKNYAEGRAVEILEPSEHRVTARCRHFGVCGGCRWQNLSYEAQKEFKRQHIINVFQHIGEFETPNVLSTIGCESPYFYRNKMEYTFSNRRWLTKEELDQVKELVPEVALGFHIPDRFDKVLNTTECFLQSELSAKIVNRVRDFCKSMSLSVYSTKSHEGFLRHLVIRDAKMTGELMVNLVTTNYEPVVMNKFVEILKVEFPEITTIVNNITDRKSMIAFGDTEKLLHGSGYITERLGNYNFRISANSFFQTNTFQAEKLYRTVKELADISPQDVVYDLYSGTGTIAIYLSDLAERVIGIEVVQSAIHDAEINAENNHVSNCYFIQGDLKDRLTKDRSWLDEHPMPNIIIVDPPRSGMHSKVVEQIVQLKPERIVYVSCNPATQARDSKLVASGGYKLVKVQPVDMFPHTDHIESIALFSRI